MAAGSFTSLSDSELAVLRGLAGALSMGSSGGLAGSPIVCVFLKISPSGQGWCWDTGPRRWVVAWLLAAGSWLWLMGPRSASCPLGALQIDLGLVGLRAQRWAHHFIQPTRHLLLCQTWAPGPLPPLGSESPTWGGEPPCRQQESGMQARVLGPGGSSGGSDLALALLPSVGRPLAEPAWQLGGLEIESSKVQSLLNSLVVARNSWQLIGGGTESSRSPPCAGSLCRVRSGKGGGLCLLAPWGP